MNRRGKLLWLFGAIALLAVVAIAFSPPLDKIAARVHQAIEFFRAAGPVAFFTAMAVLPAVGFPLSWFTVIAGPVFGPTMGVPAVIACTILASTANVALCYWIAAYAMRPFMVRLVKRLGYELPVLTPESATPVILLVRIIPGPPFFLQSYLLALARAPFRSYMIVSTLVPACYLSAAILMGDALQRRDPWAVAVAALLFVVAGVALHLLRKRINSTKLPGSEYGPVLGRAVRDSCREPQNLEQTQG